jgi:hypothetical protein
MFTRPVLGHNAHRDADGRTWTAVRREKPMILAQGLVEYSALSAVMDSVSQFRYAVGDWVGSFTPAERTVIVGTVVLGLLLWTRRRMR